MLDLLRADFVRASGTGAVSPLRAVRLLLDDTGLQALIGYRLRRWLAGAARRPVLWPVVALLAPACWLARAYARGGLDIDLDASADIGPGLLIFHVGGVRLRQCRLGSSCVVHQEVCVEPAGAAEGGPRLGDRVWVGPHARILGAVRIGDGATIGAGAVVTHDVPAGALVLGDPARVAWADYDNSELLDARAREAPVGRPEGGRSAVARREAAP